MPSQSESGSGASARFENVFIHPTAEIGANVEIGPFSFIGPNCRVGDGCVLHNGVTLAGNTVLGVRNEVFPNAVLGAVPQDKKYTGEPSRLLIGDENSIRENVTLHGGTRLGGGLTRIGNRNLLMAGSHVAHDCVLGDDVIVANGVLFGGHVVVGDRAAFGGYAAVHHFVSIGRHAFVGGLARVTQDVPPFLLGEGNPLRVRCVNRVGLERSGLPQATLLALRKAHRKVYRETGVREAVLEQLIVEFPDIPEVGELVAFLRETDKGRWGRARQPGR